MKVKDPVVLLSHWDLDGAGCSVLSNHIWNVVARKHQGYAKIRASLDYLVSKYADKVPTIVIADLKIDPVDLEYALENFDNVIYYDHHESSAEFVGWTKDYPWFTCHFDLNMCSTALMWLDGVKNRGAVRTKELDTFMQTVNVYDMWKQSSARWNHGVLLNDLFWHMGMDDFRRRFKDGLSHFTTDELLFGENQLKERKEAVEAATVEETDDGSKIVVMDSTGAIGSVSTYLEGDIFYIITLDRSPQNVSVRVKDSLPQFNINTGIMNLNEKFPAMVQSAGGHFAAGGITFRENQSVNNMVDFIYENAAAIRLASTVGIKNAH